MENNILKDLYPTSVKLIVKLLEGIKLSGVNTLLDPSAGTGNLVKYIRKHFGKIEGFYYGSRPSIDIDVIEINQDLQYILEGRGFKLVHDNFLTFETDKVYDLIVANFPFSEGDRHLDKALKMLEKSGGMGRFIVNAETLRNPYSNLRKALLSKLSQLNANIEYIQHAFLDKEAERKSSVEIALIKVDVEKPELFSFVFSEMEKAAQEHTENSQFTGLVSTSMLEAYVALFKQECKAAVEFLKQFYATAPHITDKISKGKYDHTYIKPIFSLEICGESCRNLNFDVNRVVKVVRKKYWESLLNDARFTNKYTSNILIELRNKISELENYNFSLFNIEKLQKELAAKVSSGIEDSILKLFDLLTAKHNWYPETANNIHYYNGWKTNIAHKINTKKVIIPMDTKKYYSSLGKDQEIGGRTSDTLIDMVKVFDYLSGCEEETKLLATKKISDANSTYKFREIDLRYFEVTFYKKGTAHIKFKRPELVEKMNIFASQKKRWLPPNYGKVSFSEMSAEEKSAVTAFHGENAERSYNEVFQLPEKYLFQASKNLMLGDGNIS
ncbi:MAG TPA: DUF4942 domain-containing protein [Leptospiraceae bacterium]|nr:DUF4942 domain-containing protein [Leptospiraceae bacterium]